MASRLRGISTRVAALLLPIALAGCLTSEEGSSPTSYTADRGVTDQPYPNNYRSEILAFMQHAYLNNPVGVREAGIADPVQRTIGGRLRYVVCVRYSARDSDGNYRPARERSIMFVDGRLERVLETTEPCAGAAYAAFPDLEKMTR